MKQRETQSGKASFNLQKQRNCTGCCQRKEVKDRRLLLTEVWPIAGEKPSCLSLRRHGRHGRLKTGRSDTHLPERADDRRTLIPEERASGDRRATVGRRGSSGYLRDRWDKHGKKLGRVPWERLFAHLQTKLLPIRGHLSCGSSSRPTRSFPQHSISHNDLTAL